MSIQTMLDHTALVYRLSESLNALRQKVDTYTAEGGHDRTVRIAIAPMKESREDEGAGDARRGTFDGYANADANIRETDVLDVTSGPQAPCKLRVLTVDRPRGHHMELSLERFAGSLT